jgi:ribosome-binding protein aMBF1 (putative translation factor)
MHKFAQEVGENFTLLARIETGQRYPPKQRLKKFAKLLSLAPQQLEALISC